MIMPQCVTVCRISTQTSDPQHFFHHALLHSASKPIGVSQVTALAYAQDINCTTLYKKVVSCVIGFVLPMYYAVQHENVQAPPL